MLFSHLQHFLSDSSSIHKQSPFVVANNQILVIDTCASNICFVLDSFHAIPLLYRENMQLVGFSNEQVLSASTDEGNLSNCSVLELMLRLIDVRIVEFVFACEYDMLLAEESLGNRDVESVRLYQVGTIRND